MPKLLILSDDAEQYQNLIAQAGLPELKFSNSPIDHDCEIVLGEPRKIRTALPHLSQVKWIQSIYAGVESLTDSALRRDYTLTNARGVFGELMTEYVFGYLLAHEKKIFQRFDSQKKRKYDPFDSGWLRGKTLGLLGVGSIGAHIAGAAKIFGMKVWGFTKESESCDHVDRYFHGDQRQQFAAGLDYLVVVLPRTDGTNKIVDVDLLNALPNKAILINVGRGNAVEESALVNALTQGGIAGAVLDVTEKEPLPEGHPFWTTPNLLLTFHTSAISYPEDITRLFVENYGRYLAGDTLKYQVDFERGY